MTTITMDDEMIKVLATQRISQSGIPRFFQLNI